MSLARLALTSRNVGLFYRCILSTPSLAGAVSLESYGTPLETHQQTRSVWGNLVKPNIRGRNRPNKHRDPRWSKMRGHKILYVDLPDFHRKSRAENEEVSPEEMRAEMKKMGVLKPAHPVVEAPVFISSTGAVLDEYRPPKADGFAAKLTKEGAKQQVSLLTSKGKSFRATRKIRTFDDEFDPKNFGSDIGQNVYIKAHKALAEKRDKELHKYVTEKAYPEMMVNSEGKSMYWDFVESLEPPRVVQVRIQEVLQEGNCFAQVVVRFHTKQILAIYDRFGRLIHGHPHVAKDVLEYVVFEKHVANLYGRWRLHMKIIPDWLNARKSGGLLTHVIGEEDDLDDSQQTEAEEQEAAKQAKDSDAGEEQDAEEEKENFIYDRFGKLIKKYKN